MSGEEEIVGQVAEVQTPATDTAEIETEGKVSEAEKPVTDAEDGADDDGGEVDKELKTVRKALNKKNRYIDNQRARIRALEAEIAKVREAGPKAYEPPSMDKFESVLDYVDAKADGKLEHSLAKQQHDMKMSALQQQREMALAQQAQSMAQQMNELITNNQDVQKVISSNVNVIQQMPAHIEQLMADIDNAPAATYALAKEGRLQDLYYMPPHIAAAHLVQAEIRGEQYLQQATKPKVQAPAPIGSPKGSGKSSTKPLHQMTPSELDKWRKS